MTSVKPYVMEPTGVGSGEQKVYKAISRAIFLKSKSFDVHWKSKILVDTTLQMKEEEQE